MCISLVWHAKCNKVTAKKSGVYEKDNCIKPGGYIVVLFSFTSPAAFLKPVVPVADK